MKTETIRGLHNPSSIKTQREHGGGTKPRNLQQSIHNALACVVRLENTTVRIEERIRHLQENPESAGNHEQFKNNIS
jgi:hypothetical protein